MNYQNELELLIKKETNNNIDNGVKKLLLHSCCAPCSSYVLEYLSEFFSITVFFYNPNIAPEKEFYRRVEEQKRLISILETKYPISFIEAPYVKDDFYQIAKNLKSCPEGGERCLACYRLRLSETARTAKEMDFDYFTTTLSISPLKSSEHINRIGMEIGMEFGISFMPGDFKKKNGYKRSVELSKEYDLYRQDYCGCVYSKYQRENSRNKNLV